MNSSSRLLAAAVALALAAPAFAAGNATERAFALLHSNPGKVHASTADRFLARDAIVDADGSEHVRFSRRYGGLPVIGGDFVVHSRGGQLRSVSQTQAQALSLSIRPKLGADEAIERAGAASSDRLEATPDASLAIYARGATPRLAWQVRLQGSDAQGFPSDATFIVDALDGRVLDHWNNHETLRRPGGGGGGSSTPCTGSAAVGSGKTLYSGNVSLGTVACSGGGLFNLKDMGRGGGWTVDLGGRASGGTVVSDTDNTWGNNSTSDRVTIAGDAHFGIATTWDYYKNVHGRNGIANDGKGALSRVHYGRNYANAFWDDGCFCMTFGDGNSSWSPLVALDIAGHEMSHGVTSRSANLTYSGESGGLNEATSDIFGTMVEFYANNAFDQGDYLIGEEIYVSGGGKALRYMFKPSRDGGSADCWSSGVGSLDVHYSSGVANHFYYLLAEGAVAPAGYSYTAAQLVCNGNTALAAIGRAKAEKIWYRALTVYMTSNTNYAGARVATINAANDLYGAASAESLAVAAAWSAVGVN